MDTNILYTDGSCLGNNKKQKNNRRMFVCIYDQSMNFYDWKGTIISNGSNNLAEIIAIMSGLQRSTRWGYKNIIIYIDSWVAYWWIKNGIKNFKKINYPYKTQYVLDRINKMKLGFSSLDFVVIPREKNLAGIYMENKMNGRNFL